MEEDEIEEEEVAKTCMICGEEKISLTQYAFSHRRLEICPECEKRISEGKDQDYEDLFQALADIGEYV